MARSLPSRPDLQHLRKQAKKLLASLAAGDDEAARRFREHLPAARKLSLERIRAAGYRLADAQSVVARSTGFAGWPHLARHVEQLRALEGTWAFTALEVDGSVQPPVAFSAARLVIDGDRFAMEDAMARYEGVFDIDVEASPHTIDVEFVAGPEAGNVSRGLFRLDGERLTICIGLAGRARPEGFATSPGSGHALESLARVGAAGEVQRAVAERPEVAASSAESAAGEVDAGLLALAGEWAATRLVLDGRALPRGMLSSTRRVGRGDRVTVSIGGKVVLSARVVPSGEVGASPRAVDYVMDGGAVQLGILGAKADGTLETCFAVPGRPRPTAFESPPGSGHTLASWRRT